MRAVLCRRSRRARRRGPTRFARRHAARRARRTRSRASSPRSRSAATRHPRPRAEAAHLADPRTVVIITGQQAGLFGGPLFTLLKAITAMKLARAGSARARRAGRAGVLDRRRRSRLARSQRLYGARRRVRAAHDPARRSRRAPDSSRSHASRSTTQITRAIDALAAALPDTEFRASLLDAAPRAYQPGVEHGRGVRPLARIGARAARPGRVRLVRPGGQAARARRSSRTS